MGSYFHPDHQGGRGGRQQMPSPSHEAVPRFQDQVPSSSQGQIHGETSSPLHHCASFHSRSLKETIFKRITDPWEYELYSSANCEFGPFLGASNNIELCAYLLSLLRYKS